MKVINPANPVAPGVLPADVVPGRVYQGNNNGIYYFAVDVGGEKCLASFTSGDGRIANDIGGRLIEVDAEVVIK